MKILGEFVGTLFIHQLMKMRVTSHLMTCFHDGPDHVAVVFGDPAKTEESRLLILSLEEFENAIYVQLNSTLVVRPLRFPLGFRMIQNMEPILDVEGQDTKTQKKRPPILKNALTSLRVGKE